MINREDIFRQLANDFYVKLMPGRYEDSEEPDRVDVSRTLGLCRKRFKRVIDGALEVISERWNENLGYYYEVKDQYKGL